MASFGKATVTSAMEPWGNPLPAGGHRVSEASPPTYGFASSQAESFLGADLARLRGANQPRSLFANSLTLLVTYDKRTLQGSRHLQRELSDMLPSATAIGNRFTSTLLFKIATSPPRRNRRAWSVLREMIGTVHAPRNWADDHDLYLYGSKKGESSS